MAKRDLKLPKRIAGLKIPRTVRKSANRFTRHFETPIGRELIAEAFVAAAGALVGSRYVRQTASDVGRQVRAGTENILDAGSEAAKTGASALRSSFESYAGEKKKRRKHKGQKQKDRDSISTH
jgi:hypothetical protein